VNLSQLGVFSDDIASAPQSPFEHDAVVASQMGRFVGEQSVLKQEQSKGLGNPPPVFVHCGKELQNKDEPVQ